MRRETGSNRRGRSSRSTINGGRRQRCIVPGRTLHVVDVENLNGSAQCLQPDVTAVCLRYRDVAGFRRGDHEVLASSHFAAESGALYGWDGHPQWKLRSGEHGADLELLEVLRPEMIIGHFDRIVIASGDGIFARPCLDLWREGIDITVVARNAAALSGRIRGVATDIRFLDTFDSYGDDLAVAI